MSSGSTKISVYSLPDLKNTSDDALPNYLTSLKFQQSHTLVDVRLAIGYLAVIIAAATFTYDYKFGWESSKGYTLWAVIAYFVLNSALTVWIWFIESGRIFQGSKNGIWLSISSRTTKHKPIYQLAVQTQKLGDTGSGSVDVKNIEAPFTRWFTADGHFMAKPFQDWLSSEIPAIKYAATKIAK